MHDQLTIRQQSATYHRKRSHIHVVKNLVTSHESRHILLNVTFQDFTSWGLGREREYGVVSHRRNMFHNLTREEDRKVGGRGANLLL
jgi:hypothetical protein